MEITYSKQENKGRSFNRHKQTTLFAQQVLSCVQFPALVVFF